MCPGAPTEAVDYADDAEYGEVRNEEDFDREALLRFLGGRLAGADAPMEVKQFRGGHSNLTYLLRFGETEWVMRRPPLGPLPPTAHDMGREYRILSRLWQAFRYAPRAILYCEDRSIIGAPFFVMERMKGLVIKNRRPLPAELHDNAEACARVGEGLVDTLAALHGVDYAALELAGLGRPEGFLERQIRGWMERWERAKTRELALMNRLGAWFIDHMPPPQPPALLHNDFFLHNLIVEPGASGRPVGVLDWEMATLGDPMVDLGIMLGYWRDPGDNPELIALSEGHCHTIMPGFPRRQQLAERYAEHTGRDLSHVEYYRAWAHWKTATVVEQIYARYRRGQTHDERFAALGCHAPVLAREAAAILAPLGFDPS
jgi:aminoglycoside phosphotransferase (APT) family kinase protein